LSALRLVVTSKTFFIVVPVPDVMTPRVVAGRNNSVRRNCCNLAATGGAKRPHIKSKLTLCYRHFSHFCDVASPKKNPHFGSAHDHTRMGLTGTHVSGLDGMMNGNRGDRRFDAQHDSGSLGRK